MLVVLPLLFFTIVGDVRQAATSGDLARGERLVREYQKTQGVSPESIEAYSWLARGALAAKKYDQALKYAAETEAQVLKRASAGTLDKDQYLPTALGAAIEVHGQVLGATEGRSSGVAYLQGELKKYRGTSLRARIQKNINVLSLEGQKAPPIAGVKLGATPVMLFFWAHWCPDCKAMAPVLAQVKKSFPAVQVIAPTKLYGYVAGGQDAPPAEEKTYIEAVRQKFYGEVGKMPVPISEDTFATYGSSTTPTLVLVNRKGIVTLYHPGRMTFEELKPEVEKLLGD